MSIMPNRRVTAGTLAASVLGCWTLFTAVVHAQAAGLPDLSASVVIHADAPGAIIDRHIYGQFAEHLGRGIYEGVWVGEHSKIPNVRGFRTDVVTALRGLHVPVVRWPGGCFADEYHCPREASGPSSVLPWASARMSGFPH